jgi:hypothetical protein
MGLGWLSQVMASSHLRPPFRDFFGDRLTIRRISVKSGSAKLLWQLLGNQMTQGAIYVATGTDYVDLACQSCRSLRATNPDIQVDLFTDEPNRAGLDIFDRVHKVPRVHPRAKLDCLPLSRFDQTLFLDADTLVVRDLGDIWQLTERFSLSMAHDVRRASALIREGLSVDTPYAFPQLNSGVILYRNDLQTSAFFAEWAELFRTHDAKRDQPALRDLLWQSDIRFFVLPPEFNFRRIPEIHAWEPLDARITIVHSHRLMDHMRAGSPRISTIEDLIEAEDLALKKEWRALGQGAPDSREKFNYFAQAPLQTR